MRLGSLATCHSRKSKILLKVAFYFVLAINEMIIEGIEQRISSYNAEDLLPISEVAIELGKHRMTVYRWINRGLLACQKIGKITFVPRSEVERLKNGS